MAKQEIKEIHSKKSYENVSRELRNLYTPQAKTIWKILKSDPLLIVTGPFGSGKSTLLVPKIRDTAPPGINIELIDCQAEQYRLSNISGNVPPTNNGVAILDEAGYLCEAGEATIFKTLSEFHNKGYKVIPLIPHYIDEDNVRNERSQQWQNSERMLSNSETKVIHLDQLYLRKELAKDLLLSVSGEAWPYNTLEYVLNNSPLTPKIITEHLLIFRRFAIPQIREIILDQINAGKWQPLVPARELALIKSRLESEKKTDRLNITQRF